MNVHIIMCASCLSSNQNVTFTCTKLIGAKHTIPWWLMLILGVRYHVVQEDDRKDTYDIYNQNVTCNQCTNTLGTYRLICHWELWQILLRCFDFPFPPQQLQWSSKSFVASLLDVLWHCLLHDLVQFCNRVHERIFRMKVYLQRIASHTSPYCCNGG